MEVAHDASGTTAHRGTYDAAVSIGAGAVHVEIAGFGPRALGDGLVSGGAGGAWDDRRAKPGLPTAGDAGELGIWWQALRGTADARPGHGGAGGPKSCPLSVVRCP